MRGFLLLLLLAAVADAQATVPAQMRLKDGTVYRLKEPPFLKDGRFVFTTSEGKVFSIAEKEVDEIKMSGAITAPEKKAAAA